MHKANGYSNRAWVIQIAAVFACTCGAAQAAPAHLLLESNANAGAGQELFGVTYNSYADFLSNNIASSAFSAIDINAGFTGAGFTYDGSQYHLLLESDANAGAGQELFAVTYNSFADFLNNNIASSAFSAIDVNAGFTGAGFTYDGSQYHLLLESDANAGAGQELFAVTYNSFADFLGNNIASSAFSAIDINAGFTGAGMATEWQATSPVPEPATFALFAAGLAGMRFWLRGRQV